MKVSCVMRLCFVLICVLMTGAVHAQRLTVVVKNIRSNKGKLGAALYADNVNFLKKELRSEGAPAVTGEMKLIFENVPSGDYAVSVLHDLNDNKKMDTDFLGMPKEGFGFSNNAMGTFGPPKFEKAKFNFSGKDQTVIITMKYL